VDLPDTWAYGAGVLHGGWLLETLAEEALRHSAHPHPLAVSAHYVAAPGVGPSVLQTEVLREGRSVGSLRTTLVQQDAVKVAALVSVGRLPAPGPAHHSGLVPPVLPPPEECVESQSTPEFRNGILEQLEVRLDPATAGFVSGTPGGSPESRGWLRDRSGREPDALMLLTVADALPPVTFDLGIPGWVPTVELTVLLRGEPAPGWLRCVHRARHVQGGWLDEECEVWDSADRLVVQSRQLAMYREPRSQ
jgi:hypothetical protein